MQIKVPIMFIAAALIGLVAASPVLAGHDITQPHIINNTTLTPAPHLQKRFKLNCKGGSWCKDKGVFGGMTDESEVKQIKAYVQEIDVERHFGNHERISCWQWKCLFIQKSSDGLTGAQIKTLLDVLDGYGCKHCGSVPLYELGNGFEDWKGELTINDSVDDGKCWGLCYRGDRRENLPPAMRLRARYMYDGDRVGMQ